MDAWSPMEQVMPTKSTCRTIPLNLSVPAHVFPHRLHSMADRQGTNRGKLGATHAQRPDGARSLDSFGQPCRHVASAVS